MQLSDLRKSISDMTEEELRQELLAIRSSRRISKKPPTATKAKAPTQKSEASTDTLINALSPEQIAQLLKNMGG